MITKMLDSVALEELWQGQTDGHIPVLFDIYNPDIKWADGDGDFEQDNMHLRIINDSNAIRYRGKKYLPCAFSFKAPQEDGTKVGSASATVSNLDSRVTQILETMDMPSEVTVVAAFARRDTEFFFREISHWKFQMLTASATRTAATFNLYPDATFQLNVPRDTMDRSQLNSMVEQ